MFVTEKIWVKIFPNIYNRGCGIRDEVASHHHGEGTSCNSNTLFLTVPFFEGQISGGSHGSAQDPIRGCGGRNALGLSDDLIELSFTFL